jgi:predicted metal-dependent HD superfamily phosphohydrolase
MTSKCPILSFIPPLLPNQTIYSWTAVFHEMSGNATANEARQQLFGAVQSGRHFHILSHLEAFCASTQLALGTPEDIVRTATNHVGYFFSGYTRF